MSAGATPALAEVEIDGRDRLVMPGLVNIHSHPTSEPLRKGITDEIRSPNFHHSSLYEFLTVFNNDAAGTAPCVKVALAELLRSGCTTVVDFSPPSTVGSICWPTAASAPVSRPPFATPPGSPATAIP